MEWEAINLENLALVRISLGTLCFTFQPVMRESEASMPSTCEDSAEDCAEAVAQSKNNARTRRMRRD